MSKRRPPVCLGYPSGNGCTKKPGGRWSPYWCPECDKRRVDYISAQLGKVKEQMDALSTSGAEK